MREKFYFSHIIILFFAVIIHGCSGRSSNNPVQPPSVLTTVNIFTSHKKLIPQATISFIVKGYNQYGVEMPFVLKSMPIIEPSELGEITGEGNIFVLHGKKVGRGKIIVISENDIKKEEYIDIIDFSEITTLIISPSSVTLYKGNTKKFTTYGIDRENNSVSVENIPKEWLISSGNIGEITQDGLFTALRQGTGQISVEIKDGNTLLMGIAHIEVKNRSPVISQITALPENIQIYQSSTISVSASDADNDTLTYSWSAERGKITGTNSSVTYTAPGIPGVYKISVVVTDGYGGIADGSKNITVNSASGDTWQRTYGGTNNDYASGVIQIQGGYLIAGGTNSKGAGGYDIYMVKLDSQGNSVWEKTYGNTKDEYASGIIQTVDNNYIISGGTTSPSGGLFYDAYILKLNIYGEQIWQKTYGGTDDDYASSIIQAQDGGYVASGWTNSYGAGGICGSGIGTTYICFDFYVLKLGESGNLIWQKTYGGTGDDYASSIIQAQDSGYIIAGSTNSFGSGGWDMYVVKIDTSGVKIKSVTFGDTASDKATQIIQTQDGGYIIAGETFIYTTSTSDMYIVKTDTNLGGGIFTKTKVKQNNLFSPALPYQKFIPPFLDIYR